VAVAAAVVKATTVAMATKTSLFGLCLCAPIVGCQFLSLSLPLLEQVGSSDYVFIYLCIC